MSLTINTNIPSIITQRNLNNATNALNSSIERLSTGYTINHASDDAAGYSIVTNWVTQLSSLDVAAKNAATGSDMLTTSEENYALITEHLQRIRDLTEQASNGTYSSTSKAAIKSEISARLSEIDRISANCDYNGLKLMDGSITWNVSLQVGLYSSSNSRIELSSSLFNNANAITLFKLQDSSLTDNDSIATKCTGAGCSTMLDKIDGVIKDISNRATQLGAVQNRLSSAIASIDVQSQNITSSLSTLRDTDVAEESSKYIQEQILQQASVTLLDTANQLPGVALNLI